MPIADQGRDNDRDGKFLTPSCLSQCLRHPQQCRSTPLLQDEEISLSDSQLTIDPVEAVRKVCPTTTRRYSSP